MIVNTQTPLANLLLKAEQVARRLTISRAKAYQLIQQGIHPKVVQERLGHADISLTLKTYSHVVQGMQEEAAEKLDELLTLIEVRDEGIKQYQFTVGLQ